jgi:hypothetical protein
MDEENIIYIYIYPVEYIYISPVEYYSTLKKNEIILFVGKWTKLENIILSETSQAQMVKDCLISLISRS